MLRRAAWHQSTKQPQRLLHRQLFRRSASIWGPTTTTKTHGGCQQQQQQSPFSSSSLSAPTDEAPPNLSKVLIANRGEIACRVIRTCRRWGIPTVAVYSVADGPGALHAQLADEAYLIGTGPTPAESYLLQDEVLEIAQQCRAQAIHPGYGFLSERASFAQAVHDAHLVFVGPPASAIAAMGSKAESKRLMDQAGVPTTPGYYEAAAEGVSNETPQDAALLKHEASQIGYPVLIKAVLGGGGKGMRLVWTASEFDESLASCQREAAAAFGDGRVLLEKYLVRPRHVEVQIVADTAGRVVSLYERDCSLQRRHQKVLEEAPAADLPVDVRASLHAMARQAAAAVGYVNAGTVEFLLDTQKNLADETQSFYFCEMNTRLQVEHAVTEAITGIDLVEWQLRVAAGQDLPITDSADIPCQGHAFEARIYAEQPTNHFLPATGHVWHHAPPVSKLNQALGSGDDDRRRARQYVRVDSCLQPGHDVSVYYDPMISKLIVHDAAGRSAALTRLTDALRQYQIAGVPTNLDFLLQCATHPAFQQGGNAVTTGFLDDYAHDLNLDAETYQRQLAPPLAQALSAYATLLYLEGRKSSVTAPKRGGCSAPWSTQQGSWRMGGTAARAKRKLRRVVEGTAGDNEEEDGTTIECVSNADGSFDIRVLKESFHVSGGFVDDTSAEMQVQLNHGTQTIRCTCVLRDENDQVTVCLWPHNLPNAASPFWQVTWHHPLVAPATTANSFGAGDGGNGQIQAPMPGKIAKLLVSVGDAVAKGDVVAVMEAMKMEHPLTATIDGTVSAIHVQVGDIVGSSKNTVLLEIEAPAEAGNDATTPNSQVDSANAR